MKVYIATLCLLHVFIGAVHMSVLEETGHSDMDDQWDLNDHDGVLGTEDKGSVSHQRPRRGADLRVLRRLMNNIALSEYYRLQGLKVLGTLGMGHGRPGGVPNALQSYRPSTSSLADTPLSLPPSSQSFLTTSHTALTTPLQSSNSAPVHNTHIHNSQNLRPISNADKSTEFFGFPVRSDEFQQFFGLLGKRRRG